MDELKDFFLTIAIRDCLQCLYFIDQYTVANILQEISEKQPKICCVHEWPEELLVHKENGDVVDLMVLVNGIIMSLNCELIIE